EVSEEQLRADLGLRPDSVPLLFLGRVYPEKKVGELVGLARALQGRTRTPVEIVVIGDGPDLPQIRTAAKGLRGLHFRGEIRDPVEIARYMRVAAALVIPGKVGLAVNH